MSDNYNSREEAFSKSVRAGKRTYFFDVKSTRSEDYYLIITESKKKTGDNGTPFFEKHKIFLYREDFQKFMDGMQEAFNYVESTGPAKVRREEPSPSDSSYTDVNFDDLGQ